MELRTINSIRLELPRFTAVFLKVIDADQKKRSSEMQVPFWIKLRLEPKLKGYFECHEEELWELANFVIEEDEFFAPLSFFLDLSFEEIPLAYQAHCVVLDFIDHEGVEAVIVTRKKDIEYPIDEHPLIQAIHLFNPLFEDETGPEPPTISVVV